MAAAENTMRFSCKFIATVLGAMLAASSTAWAIEILKEEPPKNALPRGKVVYVDDGTCPDGMIKEVTGGNQEKGVPRKVQCVKRPRDG